MNATTVNKHPRPTYVLWGAVILACLVLAAMWQWSPLHEWMRPAKLAGFLESFSDSAWAPWVMLAAYLVGAWIVLPISVLVLTTAVVLSPLLAFLIATVGVHLSAMMMYAMGRILPVQKLPFMSGKTMTRIRAKLKSGGMGAVMAIRWVPLAPFTVINLAAGALKIPWYHFLLGTALGVVPGLVAICLLKDQLRRLVTQPSWEHGFIIALIVAVWAARVYFLKPLFKKTPA